MSTPAKAPPITPKPPKDGLQWRAMVTIEKFRLNEKGEMELYATEKHEGNAVLGTGANCIWALLAGDAGAGSGTLSYFNNSNTRLYVGNNTNVVDPDQNDGGGFRGSTAYASCGAGYPMYAEDDGSDYNYRIAFRGLFGTSEANFAWEEWGVANGDFGGSGTLLNRRQESMGTKTDSEQWSFAVELYLS